MDEGKKSFYLPSRHTNTHTHTDTHTYIHINICTYLYLSMYQREGYRCILYIRFLSCVVLSLTFFSSLYTYYKVGHKYGTMRISGSN